MKRKIKHMILVLPVMVIAMMIASGAPVFAGTFLNGTDDITIGTETSYTLADGVTEGEVILQTGGSNVTAHVLLIKANAKAKIKPIVPGYYTPGSTKASRAEEANSWNDSTWTTASLSNMVEQYNSAADTSSQPVLAAINGDFGTATTGNAPRGSVILEGNKEMAHSKAFDDEFFFGYKDNGVVNIVQRITGQKEDFEEAVCAPMYILRNGELFGVDDENDARQRTGVAYKTNGDMLLIAVESGISVKQLAKLMKASGCWNGLNMDGGGSTTFVSKRGEDSSVVRRTPEIANTYADKDPQTGERKISNGIMVVADSGPANNVTTSNSLTTDKTSYKQGEPINVTVTSDVDGAWVSMLKPSDANNTPSYFWYYVYGSNDAGTWCWENGATYDICGDGACSNRDGVSSTWDLDPGQYRIVLFKGNYEKLEEKIITLTAGDPPTADYSLATDKTSYEVGEDIKFKATAPVTKTWVGIFQKDDTVPGDISFYYYTLNPGDQDKWNILNRAGGKVTPQQRSDVGHSVGATLKDGSYKVILFQTYDGDTAYAVKVQQDITIGDGGGGGGEEQASGELVMDGWTRDDKTRGDQTQYDYYYGDGIDTNVINSANTEGAWIGIIASATTISRGTSVSKDEAVGGKKIDVDELEKAKKERNLESINFNYVYDGHLVEDAEPLPFGMSYWMVLVGKNGKAIHAIPFIYRSFKMDWLGQTWEKNAKSKISVELEWTSKVADGTDLKPAVTIKRINGHFGYDASGEITEEILTAGKDYTITYPAESKDAGKTYTIAIEFPKKQTDEETNKTYNYVDDNANSVGYAFGSGLQYTLEATAGHYTITYHLNGGANDEKNPEIYDTNVDTAINPAKRGGHNFNGWFFDEAFTQPADTIPKGTTGPVDLYAKFTKYSMYSIITDVTGGTISSNKTVKESESYTVSYAPNDGYALERVTVDGKEVDKTAFASSYTFENVNANHTISVTYIRADKVIADGSNVVVGGSRYKVISAKGQTATLLKAKNLKKITVPSAIKLADGKTYKVVQVNAKAFTGKKIRTVTIGKNVKKISKNAFKGSKTTKVVLKTKLLKKSGVKGAFKGSKVKTVQVKVGKKKVNKQYVKKYKKIFSKKNAGKKVKVK